MGSLGSILSSIYLFQSLTLSVPPRKEEQESGRRRIRRNREEKERKIEAKRKRRTGISLLRVSLILFSYSLYYTDKTKERARIKKKKEELQWSERCQFQWKRSVCYIRENGVGSKGWVTGDGVQGMTQMSSELSRINDASNLFKDIGTD